MEVMRHSIALRRLNDSHTREGRDDGKRVYEIRLGRTRAVFNLYVARTKRTIELFRKNVQALRILEQHRLSAARILYASERDLVFVTTHVGEQLDAVLARKATRLAERLVVQIPPVILGLSETNEKPHPFLVPRPMERLRQAWEEGVFRPSTASARKRVRETLACMEASAAALASRRYRYGFGRIDGDLINFAVDARGRVATFDFDGAREFYDPYYALGYLWVSVERVNSFGRLQPRKVTALRQTHGIASPSARLPQYRSRSSIVLRERA